MTTRYHTANDTLTALFSTSQQHRIGDMPHMNITADPEKYKPSRIVERGWCKGAHARRDTGRKCETILNVAAARFDLIGAIQLARHYGFPIPVNSILLMQDATGYDSLTDWNDLSTRTKGQVIDLLESVGL